MLTQEAHVERPSMRVLADFLTEDAASAELNLKVRTLRKYRETGMGPEYVKLGRKVLYPREGLGAWLRAGVIKPVRTSRR
jgi:hypothetical protein